MNRNKTYVVVGVLSIVVFVCDMCFVCSKKQSVNSAIDALLRSNTNVLLAVSFSSSNEVLAYSITEERFHGLPEWNGESFSCAVPVRREDAVRAVNDCLDEAYGRLSRRIERVELRHFDMPTLGTTWEGNRVSNCKFHLKFTVADPVGTRSFEVW